MSDRMQRPVQVLVVEDDADDRDLMALAFAAQRDRLHLEMVDGGMAALDFLTRAHSEAADAQTRGMPDIMLIDLKMPDMDGKTLLGRVREDHRWSRLPVIVLSTSTARTDIEDAYRLGCNAYIVKPYSSVELAELAKDIIHFWTRWASLPSQT